MPRNEQTTSTDTQQRIELPPPVLACITALAADATLTAGERLTGVLMLIYGWAWYERRSRSTRLHWRCPSTNGRRCALTSPTASRTTPSQASISACRS